VHLANLTGKYKTGLLAFFVSILLIPCKRIHACTVHLPWGTSQFSLRHLVRSSHSNGQTIKIIRDGKFVRSMVQGQLPMSLAEIKGIRELKRDSPLYTLWTKRGKKEAEGSLLFKKHTAQRNAGDGSC